MENYTEKIEKFWQWFDNQYENFIKLNCYLKKPAYELQARLEGIHPNLCFQIAHRVDVMNYELILSCGHDQTIKSLIKEIAAKAPTFPLLKVSAFKQRATHCEGICLEDTSIHVNDIYYKLVPLFHKIGIHVFTDHDISNDEVQVAIILLIENLVGEELMIDHVGDIQFHPISEKNLEHYTSLGEIGKDFDLMIEKIQAAWQEN